MEAEENNDILTEDAAAGTVPETSSSPSHTSAGANYAGAGSAGTGYAGADTGEDRERLQREKQELQELLQRRQAEFENFRRRSERERSETFEYASMDTIKALLPILDDFERALKVENADKEYARGMELIYNRLFEGLRKLGLEPITNDVPIFNPHIHHAVDMVDTKDHPDQTILDEYQKGYYFKGRLLRPAMVKVAVNP